MSTIAKNTVQNMAEDLTMMIGYSMVNSYLHEKLGQIFPPVMDANGNEKINIPLEVLSGGASYLFMSGMMEIIRREEKFVEWLFAAAEAIILVHYARNKDFYNGLKNKIKFLKGHKASSKAKHLNGQVEQQSSFVMEVQAQIQNILHGRNTSHDVANTIQASNSSMDTAINREAHDLRFAELNKKSFHDSLLIKTMTGTFTATDKVILQKVIGRSDFQSVPLSIEELNKVHEFMFIKDSNGKFIGLAEAFTSLVNGLGFLK